VKEECLMQLLGISEHDMSRSSSSRGGNMVEGVYVLVIV
jgi:hypothetical protein